MTPVTKACSWCGQVNTITTPVAYCPKCGHRADVPQSVCDCKQCIEYDQDVAAAQRLRHAARAADAIRPVAAEVTARVDASAPPAIAAVGDQVAGDGLPSPEQIAAGDLACREAFRDFMASDNKSTALNALERAIVAIDSTLPNRTFRGRRDADGTPIVEFAGEVLSPVRSQRIRNHSPDGFEWGYGGSGPAQLALAILLEILEDGLRAPRLYQPFKWAVVCNWPQPGWTITEREIRGWCDGFEVASESDQDAHIADISDIASGLATVWLTCDWCHEVNAITGGSVTCSSCGHRADVSRLECDCNRCQGAGASQAKGGAQ